MNHRHRFHTPASYVRGPAEPVTFEGCTITSAIPVGVGPGGTIPVHFEVLSHAGTLTMTVIADSAHFPDLGTLSDALRAELDLFIHAASTPVMPRPGSRARKPLLDLGRKPTGSLWPVPLPGEA